MPIYNLCTYYNQTCLWQFYTLPIMPQQAGTLYRQIDKYKTVYSITASATKRDRLSKLFVCFVIELLAHFSFYCSAHIQFECQFLCFIHSITQQFGPLVAYLCRRRIYHGLHMIRLIYMPVFHHMRRVVHRTIYSHHKYVIHKTEKCQSMLYAHIFKHNTLQIFLGI